MRYIKIMFGIFGVVFVLSPFASAQVPELLPIPSRLDGHHREELANRRSQLEAQWNILVSKVNDHNPKCGKVPANTPLATECRQRMNSLLGEVAAHIEAVKSFNQMVSDAVQIARQTSIDRIEVPPPSISPLEACAGAIGCVMGARIGEGVDWLQERYWDAVVWANDPMHGDWLSDAAMIAKLPLMIQYALAVGSRASIGRAASRAVGAQSSAQLEFEFVKKFDSGLAIGRVRTLDRLQKTFGTGQYKLRWFDMPSHPANVQANIQFLQRTMNLRLPIRDVSPITEQGGIYLNAERAYLHISGWVYKDGWWLPTGLPVP